MELIENRDAQFMLLAGFIIAIGLVITTAMLNSIIFESNMAGTAGTDLKYDIVNMMRVTSDEMRSAYRNATYNASMPKYNMAVNFTNQMRNFTGNISKIYALHGEGVNISMDLSDWNNGLYPNFTENGTVNGSANWTAIESVNKTDVFELRTVNATTLSNFTIYVTNQTTGAFLWSMKLNVSNRTITKTSGGQNTCSLIGSSSYGYINLLLGTWPSPCDSTYNFSNNVVKNYKIQFLNSSDASGTFNMTGNTTDGRRFIRARDYILNATLTYSTSRVRANLTIPVSVPW